MSTRSSDLFKGHQINSGNWNLTKATKTTETIYKKSIILCSRPVGTVFPAHLHSAPTGMVLWVKQSDPIQPASHSHRSVWKHMPLTNNHGTDRITENRTAKILERSSNLLSCLWAESVVHDLLWQMSNLFSKPSKASYSSVKQAFSEKKLFVIQLNLPCCKVNLFISSLLQTQREMVPSLLQWPFISLDLSTKT